MRNTMRALTLHATWEPRPTSSVTPAEIETRKADSARMVWRNPKLEFDEIPVPRIGDDEVLIKVRACGICGSDTHCIEKDDQDYILYSGPLRLPVILGHEFSGEVIETGKEVQTLKAGDIVAPESIMWCGICTSCRKGNFNQCRRLDMVGFSAPGAFAEYIAIKEKYCWKLDALRNQLNSDDEVYEVGALIEPIGCAYNGMFVSENGFKPGVYVAVYGAGPIGLGAVLLARAAGAAKIFAFDISEPRNRLAMELGADYAANPAVLKRQGTSPGDVVREMTDGYGADIQIEAAGAASETIPEIINGFAANGKLVFLGRQDGYTHIPFDVLVTQGNRIVGARGHAGKGVFENVIRLIASGRIPASRMITSRFSFERVVDALKQSSARDEGKIMVRFP